MASKLELKALLAKWAHAYFSAELCIMGNYEHSGNALLKCVFTFEERLPHFVNALGPETVNALMNEYLEKYIEESDSPYAERLAFNLDWQQEPTPREPFWDFYRENVDFLSCTVEELWNSAYAGY